MLDAEAARKLAETSVSGKMAAVVAHIETRIKLAAEDGKFNVEVWHDFMSRDPDIRSEVIQKLKRMNFKVECETSPDPRDTGLSLKIGWAT